MNLTHNIVYIIPTYNEKENIGKMLTMVNGVLSKLKKYNSKILIVDDRSPDGTGKIVKEFQKKHKNVFLLSGEKDGLGKAIIRGIKYATFSLHADIIITNEADFSYSPKNVPIMVKMIEKGSDVVFGSRRLIKPGSWPLSRRMVHFLANTFFARYIAGITQVDDHNSAFKVVKVNGILDKIDFSKFPKGYAFFNYFTFRLSEMTNNISELKVNFKPRTKGESKISFKFKHLKSLANEIIGYIIVCFRIRYEKTFKC